MKDNYENYLDILNECIDEISEKLTYKVCFCRVSVSICDDKVDFGFSVTHSVDLTKNLNGCDNAIIFSATIGIELDRAIAKYSVVSPIKALFFQAIGAERIESLCDVFNDDAERTSFSENKYTRPRFSPGYGDFSLDFQKEIFRLLDCPRKIGLTLNDSLLMSPSKSVTGIIGIGNMVTNLTNCHSCSKTDCGFRK
ncbi:MAG: Vitamin B12 dependent methionine synthase activation subunit [Clostridia bacterium]|nr:Vitamin B12 dependent methionine synthase activation subunit [Clostridia bacterium]